MFLAVSRVFRGIMGCPRGVPGYYGMSQGCSGGFRGVSEVFRALQTLEPHGLNCQFSLSRHAIKIKIENRSMNEVKKFKVLCPSLRSVQHSVLELFDIMFHTNLESLVPHNLLLKYIVSITD